MSGATAGWIRCWRRAAMVFICCLGMIASAAAAPVPKAVLVLHQWEANLPWYGAFFSAFSTTIHANSPEPIAIFVEHLDLGRFKSPTYQEGFRRYIEQKYAERDIGIVVSVGPSALPFAVAIRAEMWPEVSVVFAPATERVVADLNLAAEITGSIVELKPSEMPCGLVADTEHATDLQRANPFLARRDQVSRQQPLVQRCRCAP